jgi:hypothetical protein
MPSGTAQFGFLSLRIAFSVPDRQLDLSGDEEDNPPNPDHAILAQSCGNVT